MKLSNGLRRIRGAITRHGLTGVAGIAARALRARGLGDTIKLAYGQQPFLSVATAVLAQTRKAHAWPPELDMVGTVPLAVWERWTSAPTHRRGKTLLSPPPRVVFLLSGGPDGVGLTLQASERLGPNASVVDAADVVPERHILYVFLQPGDLPCEQLLPELLAYAENGAEIITFNLFRRVGETVQPLLLPGPNPTLLESRDYIFSRAAVQGSVLLEAGTRHPREAILAWCVRRSVAEARAGWRHIRQPLLQLGVRSDPLFEPMHPPNPPTARHTRVRAGVSAIVCTRDKGHLTRQLVRQLLRLDHSELAEVIILSNGTSNPHAVRTLEDLAGEPRVQVIAADEPFNFSRLCNAGVRRSQGMGPLLFLNDDLAPVSEDWLPVLLNQLMRPGTGSVGPLLLYPNERVQHAGMYLRFPDGVGHILRGAALPADDHLGLTMGAREVSCLTGAVLLTDRAAFEAVGGFDEQLAISFQDVDYGLKLYKRGLRNVFEPKSILIHMESVSLAHAERDQQVLMQRYREKSLFLARWSQVIATDPFYPAGLDLNNESGRRLAV